MTTIALDARWIRPGRPDGVGRYTRSLARELLALDGGERYRLAVGCDEVRDELAAECGLQPAAVGWVSPVPLLGARDFLSFPRWVRTLGVDLLHVPHVLTSPLHGPYRTVATIHDLIPWRARGREPGARLPWRAFFATRLPLHVILGRLDRVVAVSNATRDELREDPCVTVSVDVVANGVDLPRGGAPNLADARARGPILYVGRLDPYKNVAGWLDEYAGLPEPLRRAHPLVLCGDHDPRFVEPLRLAAAALGIAGQVSWRGHVTEAELDGLYRQAALLVHPSLEEGFGLTILEAMARGTPVVAYRLPAVAEVADGAVCFAEPGQQGALAACARRLLESPADRVQLGERGLARAEAFSWRRCAVATREVHRRVLAPAGACA